MVFNTTNLFRGIPCPEGEKCVLTNCIFSHELRPKQAFDSETSVAQSIKSQEPDNSEPAAKRRKVTYDNLSQKPPSKADQIRQELAQTRTPTTSASDEISHSSNGLSTAPVTQLSSLTRSVSPPRPTNGKATSSATNNKRFDNNSKLNNSNGTNIPVKPDADSLAKEGLNPRLIPNDPAGHAKRSLYLKHLHAEMARLNQKVKDSQDEQYKQLLALTDQQLVRMALDEEQKLARDNPMVYANVVKQRIALYKKMKLEDWAQQVKATLAKDQSKPAEAKAIQTDLTPDEELLVLPQLIADQSNLAPFGYIPIPPTPAAAAQAAAAVEASKNYELCDRCSARFQIFPDRNEAGLLASNGPCRHHPNRKVFPQKTRGDVSQGAVKEAYYPCCGGVVGSEGCIDGENHVFKASTPARLAAVLPFATTPENEAPAKGRDGKVVGAVAFDCEMGYTISGMELIRLTAVEWPSGEELVDVLVRPMGAVIDLNSRFSGVWPEHFANAVPYDEWKDIPPPPSTPSPPNTPTSPATLPIVSSPEAARTLLVSFLTPQTPLIGHAIDNDLNAVRLCHPAIVDTVLLFPHPRGLPMRFGLKMLSSRHLSRSIQMGGERGHDSLEDARATGDLVRVKVGEKWKVLKGSGWRMEERRLVPPNGEAEGSYVKKLVDRAFPGQGQEMAGKKRRKRRGGMDGVGDESTEDEEVPIAEGVAAYLNR